METEEDVSLLHEALQYMRDLRQKDLLKVGSIYNCIPLNEDECNNFNNVSKDGTKSPYGNHGNSLMLNIFVLDPFIIDQTQSGIIHNHSKAFQKMVHQGLCKVYKIIQKELFPRYRKQYPHLWFMGGAGLYEGLGLYFQNPKQDEKEDVLHLRGLVRYGPNPHPDEWFSIALAFQISMDLWNIYSIQVAIECWDLQDGQILLIESAADADDGEGDADLMDDDDDDVKGTNDSPSFPAWIDLMGDYDGMKRRVYIIHGQIHLVPPTDSWMSTTSNATTVMPKNPFLYRSEALFQLTQNLILKQSTIIPGPSLQHRIEPFLQLLHGSSSFPTIHKTLSCPKNPPWLHTAAIILPQSLAQLVQKRPDLIPCAILTFCELAPWKVGTRSQGKGDISTAMEDDDVPFAFENLVVTKITLSKTLYAMLLTASGEIPPPMKVPSSYRTMESNRIKRQYCKPDDLYFRHSLECGVRLSLGLEWLLTSSPPIIHGSRQDEITIKDRIHHHMHIHKAAGGDEQWIQNSWNTGPSFCNKDEDISDYVDCPIFDLEIQHGGISPITYPFQSVQYQIQGALRKIIHSSSDSSLFPIPLIEELDSDSWIDELDKRLDDFSHFNVFQKSKEKLKTHTDSSVGAENPVRDTHDESSVKELMNTFVDIEATVQSAVDEIENTQATNKACEIVHTGEMKEDDELCIDSQVFLKVMYQVLKTKDLQDLREDNLMKYFSLDDLTDGEEADSLGGD